MDKTWRSWLFDPWSIFINVYFNLWTGWLKRSIHLINITFIIVVFSTFLDLNLSCNHFYFLLKEISKSLTDSFPWIFILSCKVLKLFINLLELILVFLNLFLELRLHIIKLQSLFWSFDHQIVILCLQFLNFDFHLLSNFIILSDLLVKFFLKCVFLLHESISFSNQFFVLRSQFLIDTFDSSDSV